MTAARRVGWLLLVALALGVWGCASLNRFQTEGNLPLEGLSAAVSVHRDGKGMAYIHARNRIDALRAQGFICAQDRLFQMELLKLFASGRISELAGEKGLVLDRRMRTIGFRRHAVRHAAMLNPETRMSLQAYVDGINAYIRTRPDTRHLEFKLAGIAPQPWEIHDSLTILYYMSWNTSANLKTEVILQMLTEALGPERALALRPVNVNPDDTAPAASGPAVKPPTAAGIPWEKLLGVTERDASLMLGSNNWAVSGTRSPNGKPVVANDPHLDARLLPGPWYPSALITPGHRIVGAGIPGIPGMVLFRNEHLAVGITNAYADSQDLYVETLDPDNPENYLEDGRSIPFAVIEESLAVKDDEAEGGVRREPLRIRLTRRGPVVSDLLPAFTTRKAVTLRWAPFETMGPEIGLDRVQQARSSREFLAGLEAVNMIMLNFVFADTGGTLGWAVSGRIPIRTGNDGTLPHVVTDGRDNWHGWIPFDEMPQTIGPQRSWLGTCNHKTVPEDYPYYLSSYFAASYRYRRLSQLLAGDRPLTVADHMRFQRDTKNVLAQALAPVMAAALERDSRTRSLGRILSRWDCFDRSDAAAPTIFQAVYREFALSVFQDELGAELAGRMLKVWYFWQERLQAMVLSGESEWFDDVSTPGHVETRDELFVLAGRKVRQALGARLGSDPQKWNWGRVHSLKLVSPIRRQGLGSGVLGGGEHAVAGSGETLCRGIYDFAKPFDVTVSASLRMVADLGDPDKVMAVIPGGIAGRVFHPTTPTRWMPFIEGDAVYWWFSDRAIREHTRRTLVLCQRQPVRIS
jgi:penicillin amidase